MNKFIRYLINFAIVSTISVLLEIYVKGPEFFFNNIVGSILIILIYYILSYFIFNVLNSICFYIFGRLQKLNVSFLNFYPLFIRRNNLYISYNILNIFKMPNTYELLEEDIVSYKQRVNKSKNKQTIFNIILAMLLLAMGVYFKVSLCNFIFSTIWLYFIINEYFNSSKYLTLTNKESLVFDELIFSRIVDKSVLEYHLEYLQKHKEKLLTKPALLDALLKLVFSCYNITYDTSDYILKLDSIIENLLTHPSGIIDITCRGLLFDYIDNRVCLDLLAHKSIGDVKWLLNIYISKSWDVNMPQIYLKRYAILLEYLSNTNQDINFRIGYELLYLNSSE